MSTFSNQFGSFILQRRFFSSQYDVFFFQTEETRSAFATIAGGFSLNVSCDGGVGTGVFECPYKLGELSGLLFDLVRKRVDVIVLSCFELVF